MDILSFAVYWHTVRNLSNNAIVALLLASCPGRLATSTPMTTSCNLHLT
jgi:hypothetical protein